MRHATIAYAGAIVFDRLLSLILLPVLTRILNQDDYGAWSQTGISASLGIIIILYAFPTLIIRYHATDTGPTARKFAFDRIGLLCICFGLLWALTALSTPSTVARIVYGNAQYSTLVKALLLWTFAEAAIEFAIAWWRALSRIGAIASILILRSTYRVSFAILIATFSGSPLSVWLWHYSIALTILAIFILALSRHAACSGPATDSLRVPPTIRMQFLEASPLVALTILTTLSGYVDRYLLAAWASIETVAIYAAAASMAAVPFMIHSALGFTLFPMMSRQWALGEHAKAAQLMKKTLLLYCFLSAPVVLTVSIFGAQVLPWLTTRDYQVEPLVFIYLSISVLALGIQQILVYSLLLEGKGLKMLQLAAIAICLNLILAFLLIPQFEMRGAALAAALANVILAAMTNQAIRSIINWRFPLFQIIRFFISACLCALPLFFLAIFNLLSLIYVLPILMTAGVTYLALDWWSDESMLRHSLS